MRKRCVIGQSERQSLNRLVILERNRKRYQYCMLQLMLIVSEHLLHSDTYLLDGNTLLDTFINEIKCQFLCWTEISSPAHPWPPLVSNCSPRDQQRCQSLVSGQFRKNLHSISKTVTFSYYFIFLNFCDCNFKNIYMLNVWKVKKK